MKNWKMFGIWICGITILPCFYDLVRYQNKIRTFVKYRTNFIQYSTMWYRFKCLFDTHLTPL